MIFVRTNSATTGLLADDLVAVVRPGLDAILLPKAEKVEEVQRLAAALDRLEALRRDEARDCRHHPADRKRFGRLSLFRT